MATVIRMTRGGRHMKDRNLRRKVAQKLELSVFCLVYTTPHPWDSLDKEITISNVCLLEKSGGKSGDFRRPKTPDMDV